MRTRITTWSWGASFRRALGIPESEKWGSRSGQQAEKCRIYNFTEKRRGGRA